MKTAAPSRRIAASARLALAGLLLPPLLALNGCAEILLAEASRAGTQQCYQLTVPAQREACLRDVGNTRSLPTARSAESPRANPSDTPAVRNDAAAAKAAARPAPNTGTNAGTSAGNGNGTGTGSGSGQP